MCPDADTGPAGSVLKTRLLHERHDVRSKALRGSNPRPLAACSPVPCVLPGGGVLVPELTLPHQAGGCDGTQCEPCCMALHATCEHGVGGDVAGRPGAPA